jgi:DNA-binding response OmpR family regulator
MHSVTERRREPTPGGAAWAERRSVLIVVGEPSTRELLRVHLALEGYSVEEADNGTLGLERARAREFDLIVLDIILPGLDGITICKAIRSHSVNAGSAIVMLAPRRTESDTVLGLESGADDCLGKPFGIRELVARAAAVLRRSDRISAGATAPAPGVHSHELTMDAGRRAATVRGSAVDLTKQEFDLLYLLAARRGIVYSRTALLAKVWAGDASVTARAVDTVVRRVRRKIESDPQHPQLILTAWGVGYKFVDAE